MVAELLSYADRVRPMVADTALLLHQALDAGKTVLLEAGQATMLDVDHGNYPFVTSSSATAGGACTGSGIPPTRIDRVVAIVKAYATRVGEGPFPTELLHEKGDALRNAGAEFGTTTGRPRRTGWFDARDRPVRRPDQRGHRLRADQAGRADRHGRGAGVRGLRDRRRRVDDMPMTQAEFARAVPIYETFPGWDEDISAARSLADLPPNCRAYVEALESMIGARISVIGVGPDRDASIVLHDLLG